MSENGKQVQALKDALRTLAVAMCSELKTVAIPTSNVWTIATAADSTKYVTMDPDRPSLPALRSVISVGLWNMAEYEAVARVLETVPEFAEGVMIDTLGNLIPPERVNITRILIANFLWLCLDEGSHLHWDEERFEKAFAALVDQLTTKRVVIHNVTPLSNLKVDVPEVAFGPEMTLTPASVSELERWLNPDSPMGPMAVSRPSWSSFYIENPAVLHSRRVVAGVKRTPEQTLLSYPSQEVPLGQVISALRLVTRAPITPLFHEQHTEGLMAFGGVGYSWSSFDASYGPVVTLDSTMAGEVLSTWQMLKASPNADHLRLPLSRWESSILRPNLEDRVIDAWIGLEALLLGEKDELSFRAGVRLAELLGTTGSERMAIFRRTRISYDWRSVIVHGLPQKRMQNKTSLLDVAQATSEDLRQALLKLFGMKTKFTKDTLESALISREHGGE